MSRELLQRPRGSAGNGRIGGLPMEEGHASERGLVLKSIAERSVARFKSRRLSGGFQGAGCSEEAAFHHMTAKDPEDEAKAVSLSLMPLKFDISREAYGTGDPFVVMDGAGGLSFLAMHGIILEDGEAGGLATLALRLPEDLLPGILGELEKDPAFLNDILHSVVPGSSGMAFSIKTRIDVICGRDYKVFRIDPGQ